MRLSESPLRAGSRQLNGQPHERGGAARAAARGDRGARAAGDRLCALLLVVLAADRPSLLSATTHTGFFPHWMAGPLGGLLPRLTRSSTTLKYLFTGGARGDVRELSARAEVRAAAARALGDRRGAGGAREPLPRASAGADRRVQLRQLRAHGGRAPPQPVHDDPDPRAAWRPELLPFQLAPAAEPVRPAVHADDLRAGPARRGRPPSGRSRRSSARRAWRRSFSCGSARGCSAATRSRRSCSSG